MNHVFFFIVLSPLLPYPFIAFLVWVYHRLYKKGSKYINLAGYCLIFSNSRSMLRLNHVIQREHVRFADQAENPHKNSPSPKKRERGAILPVPLLPKPLRRG
jgi:hypothetical protein